MRRGAEKRIKKWRCLMTTKKATGTPKKTRKSGETATDRAFTAALANVEKLAKERIQSSPDPFSTGLRMVGQIKRLAQTIETEVGEDYMSATEAGYATECIIGVGVGVI
jgi:hypothetical protein